MQQQRLSLVENVRSGYFCKGSLIQNIVVLWASISPSAVLLLPACMRETGIFLGVIIMSFACTTLFFTQLILMKAAVHLDADNFGNTLLKSIIYSDSTDKHENNNYRGQRTYSSLQTRLISLAVNIPIFFGMAIMLPCFLLIWCSCVEQLTGQITINIFPKYFFNRPVIMMGICSLIMLPFCLYKELQASRFISWLSLISGILFAITVIQYFFTVGADENRGVTLWWNPNITFSQCLKMLTISCFAFSNHENSPTTAHELINPTTGRLLILSGTVSISCFILFVTITIISYLTFGNATLPSVASNYNNSKSFLVLLSKICLSISNLVACTLSLHATVSSLSNIIVALTVPLEQINIIHIGKQSTTLQPNPWRGSSVASVNILEVFQTEDEIESHPNNENEDCATNKSALLSTLDYQNYRKNTPTTISKQQDHTSQILLNSTISTTFIPQNSEVNKLSSISLRGFGELYWFNKNKASEMVSIQKDLFGDKHTSINTSGRFIVVVLFLSFSIALAANMGDLLLLVEIATGFFETLICLILPFVAYLKVFRTYWGAPYFKYPLTIMIMLCTSGCFVASISAIVNVFF
ncbi:transmembrane amino acid transporter protein, putative [Cryptosporidium muris RN66]|uniref:Transmembrane amino acid transporter protein, putative n=1 Tax=Cryptosporidium muris (strain RN66) TaxID=441375 RepID=B6AD26_CRYMR|nr:transmembrane amino acid transporter protein, putative [Cryptosporidium muris RN66]EEA06030.1 transmembrane amino acid transporter protein, putative [Cryptosporidium muris RN66]|eukprot:XP_002140379.1 transmembrane amino acid transporter protein [Cryptosporidium muris RN66]